MGYALARLGGQLKAVVSDSPALHRYLLVTAMARGVEVSIPGASALSMPHSRRRPRWRSGARPPRLPAPRPSTCSLTTTHRWLGCWPSWSHRATWPKPEEVVRLDERGWVSLLRRKVGGVRIGTPAASTSTVDALAGYARELVRRAEAAFPTAAVAHRLRSSSLAGARDMAAVLDTHPFFDLGREPVDTALATGMSSDLAEPELVAQRLARPFNASTR